MVTKLMLMGAVRIDGHEHEHGLGLGLGLGLGGDGVACRSLMGCAAQILA
jgi:hypothetical protein